MQVSNANIIQTKNDYELKLIHQFKRYHSYPLIPVTELM